MSSIHVSSGTSKVALPLEPSAAELVALERVNPGGGDKPVSRFAPGILVKFGLNHEAEVRALQFIHGRLSVPTPRVLHHAPFPNGYVGPLEWTSKGVWYFFMEECRGIPLDHVIGNMSPPELDHIADQLLVVLKEMRSYTSMTLGSVTGGPYDNRFMPYPWEPEHTFPNVREYLDYYRGVFLEFCGKEFVDELFSCLPTEAKVCLTHGDLLPQNILVEGSTITGILDWETAGYYPEFWEYSRMHEPRLMTPAWAHVLARIFPGPRREEEITAVYQIVRYLHYNNGCFV